MKPIYLPINPTAIPPGVRFDVPSRLQGQGSAGQIAYGGFGRAEHDEGSKYMRERTAGEAIRGTGGKYYVLGNVGGR